MTGDDEDAWIQRSHPRFVQAQSPPRARSLGSDISGSLGGILPKMLGKTKLQDPLSRVVFIHIQQLNFF